MKFLTKKSIFMGSLLGALVFITLFSFTYLLSCSSVSLGENCYGIKNSFFEPILLATPLFVPLFIFSLITYRMKDEIFKSWIKFSVWWVPLSIVLTLVSPTQRGSSYIPFPSVQSIVLASSVGLFVIISIWLIVVKYRKTRDVQV